jgi:translation initiation factor 2 subunit 1
MMHKKSGFPEEGDILFCTVTKVQYNSVFVTLDEYQRSSGMIHISEISPGRIRNINDYVKEGKVIICKVLRVKKDRGHIDLSLRRVNESQRRKKVEERKQEAIAENILKSYIQLHEGDIKKLYDQVFKVVKKHYESLYLAFEDVVEHDASLHALGLDKDVAEKLEVIIRERIKPKQVEITGLFKIENYDENGVGLINAFMQKAVAIDELLHIQFLGAGRFKIQVTAPEYTQAEDIIAEFQKLMEQYFSTTESIYSFERE